MSIASLILGVLATITGVIARIRLYNLVEMGALDSAIEYFRMMLGYKSKLVNPGTLFPYWDNLSQTPLENILYGSYGPGWVFWTFVISTTMGILSVVFGIKGRLESYSYELSTAGLISGIIACIIGGFLSLFNGVCLQILCI